MIPDTAKQLLVHELSNQLTRDEVDEVMHGFHFPVPTDMVIAALRARIATKQANVANHPKTI